MDYKLLLEEILDSENYLCLATSTPLGQPWATPLCFVRGDNNNLYFVSQNESLHALHIAVNPHVAFSIFNTEQPLGSALGAQGTGMVKKIDANSVPESLKNDLFSLVSIPILQKEYSFYILEIEEVYLPDEERWKIGNELRIKVNL